MISAAYQTIGHFPNDIEKSFFDKQYQNQRYQRHKDQHDGLVFLSSLSIFLIYNFLGFKYLQHFKFHQWNM